MALLFCAVLVPTAAAVSISFSPLNLEDETLLFHNSTGTLIGVYNTSSKGIVLDNNESYSILVQPSSSDLLANHPDTWFSNFMTYFQAHAISIAMFAFIVIIVILAYKRR